MPPRRFNYQQRVGRAGRRATGVSLAVTFCRGRSHDDFYFARPEAITGDPPPTPYVDLRSRPVFKRVFLKEVLRYGFRDCENGSGSGADSVHGEFGEVTDWPAVMPRFSAWLAERDTSELLREVFDALAVCTPWQGKPGQAYFDELNLFVKQQLVGEITRICEDQAYTQDSLSERLANAGYLPMFGFPTRARQFFARWPKESRPWPPERGVVDRNLDIAISQFAPGSQTIKDKAVYTAVGVVALRPDARGVKSESGFSPPLPYPNQRKIGICDGCRAVAYVGIGEEEGTACAVCKSEMRVIDAREPRGFFSDLQPVDFSGSFDWRPRSSHPTLTIDSDSVPTLEPIENCLVSSISDHIVSINDNGGKGGFAFKRAKVYGKPKDGAWAVSTGDLDEDAQNHHSSVSTYGEASIVALLSRRMTDVLLFQVRSWPQGVFADPQIIEGRAAWYSFAFWLRIAAGAYLDVDPLELQANLRTIADADGNPAGQAFLCDALENGAGYCRHLSVPTHFSALLAQGQTDTPGGIARKWLESHSRECDTSCNRCLRDYANLAFHGLLDWRLALDMARLAHDPGLVPDLSSRWGEFENPWTRLVAGEESLIARTLARLGFVGPELVCGLNTYKHKGFKRVIIECHPLWGIGHQTWLEAQSSVIAANVGYSVHQVNPFRLLRRPVDSFDERG